MSAVSARERSLTMCPSNLPRAARIKRMLGYPENAFTSTTHKHLSIVVQSRGSKS